MTTKTSKPRAKVGRPTQQQSVKRRYELLTKSLDLFATKGYANTTIDDIESAVRMTKRTIYGYFSGKEALFKACLQLAINEQHIPLKKLREVETDDLRETLTAVANIRIESQTNPKAVRLTRLMRAEADKFPDLGLWAFEQNANPLIYFLIDLFDKHSKTGEIKVEYPEATAILFLSVAVFTPIRAMMSGVAPREPMSLEEHLDFCIHVFLNGIKAPPREKVSS